MTERADILRLQAEIREPHKIGTAESVILAALFFIPATYIVGKFLGVW